MYAIVDIETTGGKFNEEGITEIAIYKFDGHTIVDQFSSLINPERPIQPFVVNLTGINEKMLRNAPKFYEVAKRILELLNGCILVAHNAQFDYRILKTEFKRLGFDFEIETLCTVELSKKLIPDLPSYSLGKLVRSLGIPISDRHRAQGDAKATVALFKMLLDKDSSKQIVKASIKKEIKKHVAPKLLELIEQVPSETGVYYLYNVKGSLLYIGKSKNIKKRLTQHFTNENRKSKRLQLEVHSVSYELTGNDLIAQLKENEEIKKNKPRYNRALKRTVFSYQLIVKENTQGYQCLILEKSNPENSPVTTFTTLQQAKSFLFEIVERYQLCQKLTSLDKSPGSCFNYSIKQCNGACNALETPEQYNTRVKQFLIKYSYQYQHMVIIDKGRDIDEHAAVLIEHGIFQGFGFYNLNYQITNIDILKSIITPISNNRDAQHIINRYLSKNKNVKIVKLTQEV